MLGASAFDVIASSRRPRAELAAVTCSGPGSGDELSCCRLPGGWIRAEGPVGRSWEGTRTRRRTRGWTGRTVAATSSTWEGRLVVQIISAAAAAAAHGPVWCKKCTADDHSWMSIRRHSMTLLMATVLLMLTATD